MKREDLTHKIIGSAYKVYKKLGFGFLESVYQRAMIIELNDQGFKVQSESPLKVYYDNQVVGEFFVNF